MSDRPSDETESLREEIKRLRKSLSELTPSLDVLLRTEGVQNLQKRAFRRPALACG